jgi:ribulose-5-phosphate 4-epimerase/fuculose-1-phosphate aldolase
MSAVLKSKPVKERVSQEEWSLRVDLAAAYQLAAIFKWTDLIYTHFSARLPGHGEFLINPYGLMFEEITASNLIKIDHDGKTIDDPLGLGYNEAGFVIHGCVHEARPEAACVIHTHTRAGVAVSAMKCGLLPISQHAMRVQREVTYHDYEGIALDMESARAWRGTRQDLEGDDPAQPRLADRRRDGARGLRADVLPRLRLPDPDRRHGRRPGQRAADEPARRRHGLAAVQPPRPAVEPQGLACAAAPA